MKPPIALMVLVLAGAGCKDKPQQGLPPLPPPPVVAVAMDAPPAPPDPAVLDGQLARCLAGDVVRSANNLKQMVGAEAVVSAWLDAPPATAAAGLGALAEAAAGIQATDERALLLALVGRGYLKLARRDAAAEAARRALAEAAAVKPALPIARDEAVAIAVETLARLGDHAAVDAAVASYPDATAAAAVGYATANDRDRADAMATRAGTGERVTLATALVLLDRASAARAIWADAKPAAAAYAAVALAAEVVARTTPDVAAYIDDGETAVSRANDLAPLERAMLGLRLAELRHRAGDVDGASKRRRALLGQVEALSTKDQDQARVRLAEVALAAGDVATAEALATAVQHTSTPPFSTILVRVRLALMRGDIAAATEPLWSTPAAPTALGYTIVLAAYRRGEASAALDALLIERACPPVRSPGPR